MKMVDKVVDDYNVIGKQLRLVIKDALVDLMSENENIVVLDADLGQASKWIDIRENFPTRFVECGIAEANMVGVAAGMSTNGMIPFIHSFAPFVTRRVFDQLYLSGAYSQNTINIYGSDPGYFANGNGGTHTTFEDISLMKSIPSSKIFEPADGVQLDWLIRKLEDMPGINYVRAPRQSQRELYKVGTTFQIGKGNIVREGEDIVIIASGVMVNESMLVAELLAEKGIQAQIIDMFTIKPLDINLVLEVIKDKKLVVTVENHSITGGLGSSIADVIAKHDVRAKLHKIGIDECFGEVGPVTYLQDNFGLTADKIYVNIMHKLGE